MIKIFVTGGAGYIGSHTVKKLEKLGYEVIVYDNLVYGHEKSLSKNVVFIKGDLSDLDLLRKTFEEHKPDAVMHFASYLLVGESTKDPIKYFENNVSSALNLLKVMVEYNVSHIIFSSSAAVYGIPKNIPITEEENCSPINPYGETKLCFEKILKCVDEAHNIKYASLRYFNACGADDSREIGEDHNPETHLIPLIMMAALGKRENIKIFGTDYETKDGTCIRDYIHVNDIANAHILALKFIMDNKKSEIFNLGTGSGHSVKEIIDTAIEITKKDIKVIEDERRDGDPPILVADYKKAKKMLKWKPEYSLKQIISTAWNWHNNNPDGFQKNKGDKS